MNVWEKPYLYLTKKGGVGKTTTCVNFAAALGLKGKKTLLVDLDPQGNTTSGVGIDKTEIEKSTYDILINDEAAKDIVIKTEFKIFQSSLPI